MSVQEMKQAAIQKMDEAERQVGLADRIEAWAMRMLGKLFENAEKGGPEGWEVLVRVHEELEELKTAMKKKRSARLVYDEAADVANMVMMVADAYYRMRTIESAKKAKS